MDDPRSERPEAEKNLGLFLNSSPAGVGSGYLVLMKPLNVGPGEPGPGDEWHVPPADEAAEGESRDDGPGGDRT
jgi:hypothetical protein